MASITIRNFDDEVKTKLRVRAADNGRSLAEEVRLILRDAAGHADAPKAIHERGRPACRPLGRFIREYSQILSGLTIAAGSLFAAMIIGGGVERGLEGSEDIAVTVHGFNSTNSTDRLVLAHNYGARSGTLMAEVVIVVSDVDGNELERLTTILNPGVAGGTSTSPFTLPGEQGIRYFLNRPALPTGADSCVLEFQVMQRDRDSRAGKSSPFKCSTNSL